MFWVAVASLPLTKPAQLKPAPRLSVVESKGEDSNSVPLNPLTSRLGQGSPSAHLTRGQNERMRP